MVKAAYDGIYLGDFDNAEFAERIAKVPLAEQPRTLWDYGHSIDILGRVIEVASGLSLYQFEKTQLLDPLGMTTTKFFLTGPDERARYAEPLAKDRHVERNSLDVTRWESGGGGMVSTVADMARYGQMLLNGGTLDGKTYLSHAAFAAMTTDHIGPGLGRRAQLFLLPRRRFRIWLRLWRPHRSRQRRAAAAGLARGDQMGRRHRSLPCGRPRPGHVLRGDGECPIRTDACPGNAEEDHLRRVREMI